MDEMNEILRLKKLVKNSEVIPQGWFFISFFISQNLKSQNFTGMP